MKRFFHDILRDKGSKKISITKVLAFIMSMFFITYLIYYLLILQKKIDHTLVIEMIGFISALVGMKNNWGVRGKENPSPANNTNEDTIVEPKKNDDVNDDAVF